MYIHVYIYIYVSQYLWVTPPYHYLSLLGGSSHLVSGLVHPSYKWTNPTYPIEITRVVTHLRFVG